MLNVSRNWRLRNIYYTITWTNMEHICFWNSKMIHQIQRLKQKETKENVLLNYLKVIQHAYSVVNNDFDKTLKLLRFHFVTLLSKHLTEDLLMRLIVIYLKNLPNPCLLSNIIGMLSSITWYFFLCHFKIFEG